MISRYLYSPIMLAILLIGFNLAGCKSTPKEIATIPTEAQQFMPIIPTSPIQSNEGRYPNLFRPASFAVWVDEEISDLKKLDAMNEGEMLSDTTLLDAAAVHRRFHVIELHLDSSFGDASIAYDSVGLRNIDVYFHTSDGDKIYPAQIIKGEPAKETQVEALRNYTRRSILLFPKIDPEFGGPYLTSKSDAMRLYLHAFNSEFYFQWQGIPSLYNQEVPQPSRIDIVKQELTQKETYQVLSMRFNELYDLLRNELNRNRKP